MVLRPSGDQFANTPLGAVPVHLVDVGQLTDRAVHGVGLGVVEIVEERGSDLDGCADLARQDLVAQAPQHSLTADHDNIRLATDPRGRPEHTLELMPFHAAAFRRQYSRKASRTA
jgi:hypothetical protein